MNMFEYVCLCRLNDLLSSGEVSQDWPSSMHDHMSTPFLISLSSDQRSAVQAFCFIFTKHFYCLQNHIKYIFMFVVNLGRAGGIEVSNATVSNTERLHRLYRRYTTYHWSLEVICDPFALRSAVLSAVSMMRSH